MSGATKSAVVRHSSSILCHVHDGSCTIQLKNKVTSFLCHRYSTAYLQRTFIPVSRYVKVIKIH